MGDTRKHRGSAVGEDLPALLTQVEARLAAGLLDSVSTAFSLSAFERRVLVLCAAVELDSRVRAHCAAVHADPRVAHATWGFALAELAEAHWSAMAPGGPLRRWHLIEIAPSDVLTRAALRMDERLLHHLLGVAATDARLSGIAHTVAPPRNLSETHLPAAAAVAQAIAFGGGVPLIQLVGCDRGTRLAVAAAATAAIGMPLYRLDIADVPSIPAERELLIRLIEREALLTGAALFVEPGASPATALAFLSGIGSIVFVDEVEPATMTGRAVTRIELAAITPDERRRLWVAALGASAAVMNGHVDQVAEHFNLDPHGIRSAASVAARDIESGANPGDALWAASRTEARRRLADLTQRIDTRVTWDALVLPAATMHTLRTIVAHVRQRAKVYREWGFADRGARGLGVSALFAGPSGTGKTMAAEVLATELRLDLHRIDLSALISKYIGETEKNLRRVFEAAEEGGAILLFDEADALFGRRSEVKDSHDRYANVEVSYLLQRMESYRGLAILTTNMRNAIDPAFLRRIRFVVNFPFPDAAQRKEIWRRVCPPAMPVDHLDISRLSRLALSGGSIRNLALNAAFLAADAGEPVRMQHLLTAATGEYAKLDRALSESDTEGWT